MKKVLLLLAMIATTTSMLFTSCDQVNSPNMVASAEAGVDVPTLNYHGDTLGLHVNAHATVDVTHVLDSLAKGFTFESPNALFNVKMDSLGHFSLEGDVWVRVKLGNKTAWLKVGPDGQLCEEMHIPDYYSFTIPNKCK